RRSPHAPAGPKIPIAEKTDTAQAQVAPAPAAEPTRKGSTKTQVYSVRVPKGFKGEIQSLQARLQLEREQGGAKARKVSGAEM
ncbi:hypothetical protein ABTL82_19840, partial [Acinetobacter baumannii]